MIISQTPMRISLAGGGTDLSEYYSHEPGAVLATAINKYMYITVNRYFEKKIFLKYSKTELVDSVGNVRHPLLRESLRLTRTGPGVEITSMADVIGGTGLGSSSSFTVGVLHALHALRGKFCSAEKLAREACDVEINRVKEPIGKQDQYIAAHGGFQFIQFGPGEQVSVNPLLCPPRTKEKLLSRLMLFYTGATRSAGNILRGQRTNTKVNIKLLGRLSGLAHRARKDLSAGDSSTMGEILHEGWEIKKQLAKGISNPEIDGFYARARKAGATGGKILGAGGGGFLLLYCPVGRDLRVKAAMRGLKRVPFGLEPHGSKIIYVSD